ncbi:MAG: hypothetical protein HC936_00985 [Leptolyngbyaceae cyanobacterium SU_3_3]|nr:hypothetical protein [Leptolyngbyaceae cyanobacterium SU_3_3]NJR51948.1 hypothetical protein [Leptolyngbyaceae cyanobacterium CSU_1_3]
MSALHQWLGRDVQLVYEQAYSIRSTASLAMQSALYLTAKVSSGNKIELELPPGSGGQEVGVFVVLPQMDLSRSTADQNADLAAMANDPEIQAELAAIA